MIGRVFLARGTQCARAAARALSGRWASLVAVLGAAHAAVHLRRPAHGRQTWKETSNSHTTVPANCPGRREQHGPETERLTPPSPSPSMFFGFNVFDPKNSPAINTQQEAYKSRFTTVSSSPPHPRPYASMLSVPMSPCMPDLRDRGLGVPGVRSHAGLAQPVGGDSLRMDS